MMSVLRSLLPYFVFAAVYLAVSALGVLAGLALGFSAATAYLDQRAAPAASADSEVRNIVDKHSLEFDAVGEGGPD